MSVSEAAATAAFEGWARAPVWLARVSAAAVIGRPQTRWLAPAPLAAE